MMLAGHVDVPTSGIAPRFHTGFAQPMTAGASGSQEQKEENRQETNGRSKHAGKVAEAEEEMRQRSSTTDPVKILNASQLPCASKRQLNMSVLLDLPRLSGLPFHHHPSCSVWNTGSPHRS